MDDPQKLLSSPEPPDTNSAATGGVRQRSQSPTDSEESGHEYDEDHDVWATSENGSIDLQVQARRHSDEYIEKILELAAPGVTGTERDRLADLVRSYRDVFAQNDDREWLGGRREVGPRDVKSTYFHNLIDRWKKLFYSAKMKLTGAGPHRRSRSRSSFGVLQMLWGRWISGLCRSRTTGTS